MLKRAASRQRLWLSLVFVGVTLLTACARSLPTTSGGAASGSGDMTVSPPVYSPTPADELIVNYDNPISGDPVASIADAQGSLPFTVLDPSGLGDPTGIYLLSKNLDPNDRVIAF